MFFVPSNFVVDTFCNLFSAMRVFGSDLGASETDFGGRMELICRFQLYLSLALVCCRSEFLVVAIVAEQTLFCCVGGSNLCFSLFFASLSSPVYRLNYTTHNAHV